MCFIKAELIEYRYESVPFDTMRNCAHCAILHEALHEL